MYSVVFVRPQKAEAVSWSRTRLISHFFQAIICKSLKSKNSLLSFLTIINASGSCSSPQKLFTLNLRTGFSIVNCRLKFNLNHKWTSLSLETCINFVLTIHDLGHIFPQCTNFLNIVLCCYEIHTVLDTHFPGLRYMSQLFPKFSAGQQLCQLMVSHIKGFMIYKTGKNNRTVEHSNCCLYQNLGKLNCKWHNHVPSHQTYINSPFCSRIPRSTT